MKTLTNTKTQKMADARHQLIGIVITEADLSNYENVNITYGDFKIMGRSNRRGGGYHHNPGTYYPTSNPLNCESYWCRYRADGSYDPHASSWSPNAGQMCWVEMNDGQCKLGCIINKSYIVIYDYQFIVNRQGNIAGLSYYYSR